MVVVLPAPLGPRRPRISCGPTAKERSSTATKFAVLLRRDERPRGWVRTSGGAAFSRSALSVQKSPSRSWRARNWGATRMAHPLLGSEIHHVDVDAEADVVGEIPAWVVGIGIEDDVVGIPEPAVAIAEVGGSDAEVVSAKPEAGRTAAADPPDLACADAAGETAMLPGVVEVVGGGIGGVWPTQRSLPASTCGATG